MRLALVCFTDGRWDFLDQTLTAARKFLPWDDMVQRILVNDSASPVPVDTEGLTVIDHPERRGLSAAINTAWSQIDSEQVDYVVHLEDDCVLLDAVDVGEWVWPLTYDPLLCQVTLQRGPQNPDEIAHGGILRMWGAQGHGVTRWDQDGHTWTSHQRLFSLQPSIYRSSLTDLHWPDGQGEHPFALQLWAEDCDVRMALLGDESTEPHYEHVGYCRRTADWKL